MKKYAIFLKFFPRQVCAQQILSMFLQECSFVFYVQFWLLGPQGTHTLSSRGTSGFSSCRMWASPAGRRSSRALGFSSCCVQASLAAVCGFSSRSLWAICPWPWDPNSLGLNARVPPWKVDSQPLDHQGRSVLSLLLKMLSQILDSCLTGFYAFFSMLNICYITTFWFSFF